MAKGQQKSNREAKKPKKNKKATAPPSFSVSSHMKTGTPMPGDKKK